MQVHTFLPRYMSVYVILSIWYNLVFGFLLCQPGTEYIHYFLMIFIFIFDLIVAYIASI